MPIRIGIFVVPDATDPRATIDQIVAADESGLDFVGIQDHPYQRRFFDTWTLLAYAGARTERVRLLPDVVNLPLRMPSVLAKSAASLDLLTGGRVELGLGAGSFWDAIEAMGGPRRTPKESVDALEEAIAILRAWWSGERSVQFDGEHYRVHGAKPGPPPAHPIEIWLGAYGPRMLRITGRAADGWLPSLGYMDPDDAPRMQAAVDDAARAAGRDPADIERALNVMTLGATPAAGPTSSPGSRPTFASRPCSWACPTRIPRATSGASAKRWRRGCGNAPAEQRRLLTRAAARDDGRAARDAADEWDAPNA